jgi:hypothetical protein
MKTRTFGAVIAGLVIGFSGQERVYASVTVSPATGGANISADTAANAPTPMWTTLGAITITEGTNTPGDFANGTGKTLVLAAPGGFQFNTAQIPSVTFAPGGNITSAGVSSLTTNKLTVTLTVVGTTSNDSLTIGGATNLQVRPTAGNPLPVPRNIFWPSSGGGNASIAGIVTDSTGSGGTSFGALSEVAGAVSNLVFTTQPASAVAGNVFGIQPVVQAADQFGNPSVSGLGSGVIVTVSQTSGPGNLIGTTNLDAGTSAGNGAATYTDLLIDTPGTNDQLTASSTGLVSAVSSSFIVQATQTISFSTPTNHFYGDSFALSALASSGLPVSFSVLSGPAAITNGTITLQGTGAVSVRASQAGNAVYAPAPNVDDSFIPGPAPLTITPNNTNRPYLSPNPTFTAAYAGLVNGDSSAALTGTLTFSTPATTNSLVGAYGVSCSGQSSTNYNITFANGALNVTPLQWATNAGGNGHYYEAVLQTGGITWSNAQAAAIVRGGYLATLTSSAENDFAYGLVSGNANFWATDGGGGDGPWIGAYKLPGPTSQTNWAWVTGEAFVFNNWGPNQPNNFGGRQNFIQLYSPNSPTGELWNDAGDDDILFTRSYLVEYDTFTNRTGQTINFAPLPDKASGDPPFVLSAMASSGLPVTFTVVSGPASIAGSTLTISGVGAVVIDALQAGNSNYFAAPDVIQSFNVNRSQWATNAGGNGHLYEVVHIASGITWSNAEALAENAGGYLASITSSNENTFVLSLVNGNSNLWVINGGSEIAFGPWLGGIQGSGPSSPTNWTWVNGDAFIYQNWGPGWPNSNGDHIQLFSPTLPFTNAWSDLSDTGLALSYIIEYNRDPNTRSNQTISFGPLPDRTYGDPPFYLLGMNSSGLPIVYTVIYGTATITNGNSLVINSAGTVVVQASAVGNSNYFAAPNVSAQFNVNIASLSVTASDAARSYGNTNPIFSGFLNGVQYNDNITATYSASTVTNSPIGQYAIVPMLVDPGNRLPNYSVTVTNGVLTVIPANLSVTASNASRTYGATNPVFTGIIVGIQNGDNISATYSTTASNSSPPGMYPIIPSLVDPGMVLSNYSVFTTNGILAVTPSVAFSILSAAQTGGNNLQITWSSISNSIYRVQYKTDLTLTNWISLTPDVIALDVTASFTDTNAVDSKRFYRVLLLSH